MLLTPAQIKPKSFEPGRNFFFFTRGGCVSCLRGCLGARLLPQSYQYPNLSEDANRVGGQLCGDKRVPLQWRNQIWQFGGRCQKAMLGVCAETCEEEEAGPSNRDIMTLLMTMNKELNKKLDCLNGTVERLEGEVFDLKQENTRLNAEVERCRKKEEDMQSQIKEADTYYALSCGLFIKNHHSTVRTAPSLSTNFSLLGGSGGVVNSLDFCPALLKSLGCFYFRCVLSSQWKAVTVNMRI